MKDEGNNAMKEYNKLAKAATATLATVETKKEEIKEEKK